MQDQEKFDHKPEALDLKTGFKSTDLPTPVSTPASKTTHTAAKYKLSSSAIVPVWIVLSSSVIIFNNYVYNTIGFKYPVFLVTWHLVFAAIGTRILQRTTNLLDGAKEVHVSKDMYIRSILPIGFLFSGSLILSNTAYLYLSVSYIQMLKVRLTDVTLLTPSANQSCRPSLLSQSFSFPGLSGFRNPARD